MFQTWRDSPRARRRSAETAPSARTVRRGSTGGYRTAGSFQALALLLERNAIHLCRLAAAEETPLAGADAHRR